MILATGGFAFGEISIRSSFNSSAFLRASTRERVPIFSPSGPTTRSSDARMALLIRVLVSGPEYFRCGLNVMVFMK